MRRHSELRPTVVEPDEAEVHRRLEELGVPWLILGNALRIGHQAADFVTASYPPCHTGQVVYGETTAGLRSELGARGWENDDTNNIARIVSPCGETVVVVNSGNRYTGRRGNDRRVSTRYPRGRAAQRIINDNLQMELFDPAEISVLPAAPKRLTWILLYDRRGDTIRSELSCPVAVSETGEVTGWRERLVLPAIDLTVPSPTIPEDEGPSDVDVTVTRRVS